MGRIAAPDYLLVVSRELWGLGLLPFQKIPWTQPVQMLAVQVDSYLSLLEAGWQILQNTAVDFSFREGQATFRVLFDESEVAVRGSVYRAPDLQSHPKQHAKPFP